MSEKTLFQNPMRVQSAATTGTGGVFKPMGQTRSLTAVLQGNGTTSGGTILLEHAYWDDTDPTYSGTWTLLSTLTASDVSGGKQIAVFAQGSFWAVRARISSDITGGGSVTVTLWGN